MPPDQNTTSPALGSDRRPAHYVPQLGGKLALTHLIDALENESPAVRKRAIAAMQKLGGDNVIDSLLATLEGDRRLAAGQAAHALGRIADPRAVPKLLPFYHNPRHPLHNAAVTALGRIGREHPDAIQALVDEQLAALHSSGFEFALHRLKLLRPPAAVAPLCAQVVDRSLDRILRRGIVDVLGAIKDPRALPTLCHLAESYEETEALVRAALHGIGAIGGDTALEFLTAYALHDRHDMTQRWQAVHGLGQTRDKRVSPFLIHLLRDNRDLRRAAERALINVRSRDAIPDLLDLLDHDHPPIRRSAAVILGERRVRRAAPRLIELLDEDAEASVRAAAARGLRYIAPNTETLTSLIEALNDLNLAVRLGAARAISHINRRHRDLVLEHMPRLREVVASTGDREVAVMLTPLLTA